VQNRERLGAVPSQALGKELAVVRDHHAVRIWPVKGDIGVDGQILIEIKDSLKSTSHFKD